MRIYKPMDAIKDLNELGVALSREKSQEHLLELILIIAKKLTHSDAGTLFMMDDDGNLRFEVIRTDSLGFAMGGTTGNDIPFPPVRLHDEHGRANLEQVVACSVLHDKTINIPDAYTATDFDFSGTRAFDAKTGYRSTSFLCVPMKDHNGDIIGVLELINALDAEGKEITAFGKRDEQLAESLASQAAVALTNKRLIEEMRILFESFIQLIATAIDKKSTHTGAHCTRVPELTLMLAEAASRQDSGPLQDFTLDDGGRYELEIAAWLHDCGKITTPEYVVEKSTKLETICDRINLINARFASLHLMADYEYADAKRNCRSDDAESLREIEQSYQDKIKQIEDDRQFLRRCNTGGEFMREEDQDRVRRIATQTWRNAEREEVPLLTEEEVKNLTIAKGTLLPEEREIINDHIVMTIKMLESLPFPKHLRNVPEFAGGHHERMDGKGYPNGLVREQMSVQARTMAIADIFEALTASDRPYKKAMPISRALQILGNMKLDNHIDPDLFDVFVREKVYEDYARQYLRPEQLDEMLATNRVVRF
ncbi:MAG: phosphohydrolase [Zetaproteobacteria bacterium CG1_02_55_237]|nr:MAG: phosphohydrolase [Zetaproteobacteria bacterium CG1_02_55_237]